MLRNNHDRLAPCVYVRSSQTFSGSKMRSTGISTSGELSNSRRRISVAMLTNP